MEHNRRHAAIMFTDIVGYTALMGSDEDKAFEVLLKNREIHTGLIDKFSGMLIKEMGDGMLISFNLSSDAVRCAIEIQKNCKKKNVPLKIGIHEGEMVFEGGDVLGDNVNIASRLQENAMEGGIHISVSVYRNIKNKANITTRFIGEKEFKNVNESIKVYEVICEPIDGKIIRTTSMIETRTSIAVLAFTNMSTDPEQENFCDGMSEEIINALSHIPDLKVIARTSAFIFKGRNEDVREIGRKLDVENLLEGSVRKAGNKIRVTAQLIKVSDGSHLWSEGYERKLEDVFAIQDEISLSIVDNLKVKLFAKEKEAMVKRHTNNVEANLLFLKGRQSRLRKNFEDFQIALDYLEKSVSIDPDFSLAYAEIALTYLMMGSFGVKEANNELREKIVYYANKCLDLNNKVSEAYIALALTWEIFDHDLEKAENFARQAVNFNRGNNEAIQEHAFILGRMGHFAEAIEKMEYTITLDPLSIMANNGLGYVLFYQGSFEAAIKQMRNILALDPLFFPARFITCLSLTELQNYSMAMEELHRCPQSNPLVVAHRGYLHAKMGKTDDAIITMDEIKNEFSNDPLLEFLVALIYTGLEDKEKAFTWLQKSQENHGFVYRDMTIGADFRMIFLKEDPRFSNLIFY